MRVSILPGVEETDGIPGDVQGESGKEGLFTDESALTSSDIRKYRMAGMRYRAESGLCQLNSGILDGFLTDTAAAGMI